MTSPDDRLAAVLLERGLLDPAALDRARRAAAVTRGRLAPTLASLGLLADRHVAEALAAVAGLPLLEAADYPGAPLFADTLSADFLRAGAVLPVAASGDAVVLAMADPFDGFTAQAVAWAVGRRVDRRVAVAGELEAALERLYAQGDGAESAVQAAEDAAEDADAERLKDLAGEAPVIRFVNRLIADAVAARASDIHLEPQPEGLRIRIRVDGLLRPLDPPPPGWAAAVVSRVKVMARLDIAERRLPQDGRIRLAVRGRDVDIRVSTLPTLHGEKVALRLLDRSAAIFDLADLGFGADALGRYLDLLARPNGILLVTGPTGSGKTTTLYASLLRLNDATGNIVTVEDPVEYQLAGISQVPVRPGIGLDFARVLRAILRQDPDIVMVGEIRDGETAEIAAQAALTGHLVLSTVHTTSAAGTVTRLRDMGVPDYLIASTVVGIAAQRLVRRLCPHCREAIAVPPELAERLALDRLAPPGAERRLFRPRGCHACDGTGFHGRCVVAEVLVMDEELRRAVLRQADSHELQRIAVAGGLRPLHEDGLLKALAGETTLEEVLRVTREA
ncbi:GspE/PulE family protein [Azospirillum sp. ST 5-10]|uniref:GspE/PulE family protein n=1 Tax=unclassified Azospirillum TaxID=2630922 RepID=UPI003F4A5580